MAVEHASGSLAIVDHGDRDVADVALSGLPPTDQAHIALGEDRHVLLVLAYGAAGNSLSAVLDAFVEGFAETKLADVGKPTRYLYPMLMAMLSHQGFGSETTHALDVHAPTRQQGRLLLHDLKTGAGGN
ncbi:hypothetical protein [Xanthomonas sp. 3307]|uniref:hypothetical protein n=1 Tax=Xanthomonas sp. 3307 TaxID=3035316 RepID=UPI00161269BC|nr:hypothetical protein [Xanthomonas sp. 3307]MBB5942818.1 hypothetical protein [Xanthomonas sp. 3307]